jgi:kallikrein
MNRLKLDSHINVTCLPPSNASFENVRCVATGWGKDKFGSTGKYDPLLKKIELPLVQRNTCQENLRATRLRRYFYLHPSFLCAGGEKDKDACIGDGGGPLVCPINGQENKYYQIGVVSWGIECGQENVPAVYSNIPFLRQWIDKQMQDKNLDISVYQY